MFCFFQVDFEVFNLVPVCFSFLARQFCCEAPKMFSGLEGGKTIMS